MVCFELYMFQFHTTSLHLIHFSTNMHLLFLIVLCLQNILLQSEQKLENWWVLHSNWNVFVCQLCMQVVVGKSEEYHFLCVFCVHCGSHGCTLLPQFPLLSHCYELIVLTSIIIIS